MVDMLLDTNILVDMLRSYAPAIAWKNAQGNAVMGIPSIVYMEVLQGAQNTVALQNAIRFLHQFDIVYVTENDQKWASQQLVKYRLSNNVDFTDALIAAPAFRLNLPLHTRNLKHFTPLIPKLVNQPY